MERRRPSIFPLEALLILDISLASKRVEGLYHAAIIRVKKFAISALASLAFAIPKLSAPALVAPLLFQSCANLALILFLHAISCVIVFFLAASIVVLSSVMKVPAKPAQLRFRFLVAAVLHRLQCDVLTSIPTTLTRLCLS